jgi:hypothetical protein
MPPKPHDCCICHSKEPLDFYRGMKSLCKKCKSMGYSTCPIAPNCTECGENKAENFYCNRVSLCKKCYNRRKTINKYPEGVRPVEGYRALHCLKCKTTDESKFTRGMKSLCKKCYKTNRVSTLRIDVPEEKEESVSVSQTVSSVPENT